MFRWAALVAVTGCGFAAPAVHDAPASDASTDSAPDAPPSPCDLPALTMKVATLAGCADNGTDDGARGAARFTARITDATRPGVVVVEGIWWHRFHPGGRGVNVLTDDRVADMGGGPAFHSNLVEVTRT